MKARRYFFGVLLVVLVSSIAGESAYSNGSAEALPTFIAKWGEYGTGPGQMRGPQGIVVGPDGRTYVADQFNNRIQIYSTAGAFIGQWGGPGEGHGQFQAPGAVAVGASGVVYVLEFSAPWRVQAFTSGGVWLREWDGSGQLGGVFPASEGLATDDSGYVYVVNTPGQRILKYTSEGVFVSQFGIGGNFSGKGAATDNQGHVYVADVGRIVKFATDGAFLGYLGEAILVNPQFVATDASGSVYVTDPDRHRVVKFSPDGKELSRWGSGGEGSCAFVTISGIAVDSQGDIYVADSSDPFPAISCIQRFSYSATPVLKKTWGSIKAIYR